MKIWGVPPATWAVGSYSSSPPTRGTPQILIFKTLWQSGWKALYTNWRAAPSPPLNFAKATRVYIPDAQNGKPTLNPPQTNILFTTSALNLRNTRLKWGWRELPHGWRFTRCAPLLGKYQKCAPFLKSSFFILHVAKKRALCFQKKNPFVVVLTLLTVLTLRTYTRQQKPSSWCGFINLLKRLHLKHSSNPSYDPMGKQVNVTNAVMLSVLFVCSPILLVPLWKSFCPWRY